MAGSFTGLAGRLFADLVGTADPVTHGIAFDVEITPATGGMQPLFAVPAPRILAHEQVIGPLFVAELIGLQRARDMGLAVARELTLVAGTAIFSV